MPCMTAMGLMSHADINMRNSGDDYVLSVVSSDIAYSGALLTNVSSLEPAR